MRMLIGAILHPAELFALADGTGFLPASCSTEIALSIGIPMPIDILCRWERDWSQQPVPCARTYALVHREPAALDRERRQETFAASRV